MAVRRGAGLIPLVLVAVVVSCGGGSDADEPRALTQDEATRLAGSGYSNFLAGGADFEANSAFLTGGAADSVTLVGSVDWATHAGRALVRADAEPGLVEVYWEESFIVERRTTMDSMVVSLGGPAEPWYVRDPQPGSRQVDRLVAVVMSLAMEQPENALLIRQKEGSVFLRSDQLRGIATDVVRFGERNIYWLEADTDTLLRFEGNAESGTAPVVVDLLEIGTVEVTPPRAEDVLSPDTYPEVYDLVYGNT